MAYQINMPLQGLSKSKTETQVRNSNFVIASVITVDHQISESNSSVRLFLDFTLYLESQGNLPVYWICLCRKTLFLFSPRLWGSGFILKSKFIIQQKTRCQHRAVHLMETEVSGADSATALLFRITLDYLPKVQMLPWELTMGPPGTPRWLQKPFSAWCFIFSSISTKVTANVILFSLSRKFCLTFLYRSVFEGWENTLPQRARRQCVNFFNNLINVLWETS